MQCSNSLKLWLSVLTDVWRRRGEAVAHVLFAAAHVEALKGGRALLHEVRRETAPLLRPADPAIEAAESSASSILTRALLVFAYAQQLPSVFCVWSIGKHTETALADRQGYELMRTGGNI